MSEHPYTSFPDYAFWRRSIADIRPELVDPVVKAPFKIAEHNKVATAGSCFAQHIARYLQGAGFNYFVAETAHPLAPEKLAQKYSYGEYSARYGNIYTSRQLLQIFDRAFGTFEPIDDVWERPDGGFSDPFRTNIQPGGYITQEELLADRKQHFAAVRRLFEELDVFVFTLGLTETWRAKADGAVFPLCPGVDSGMFDAKKYEFHNLSVDEVTADMSSFLKKIRNINPKAKVILTVSPVPLIATAEDRHVLVSTTYSKAVLRVAAENIVSKFDEVCYFPSFEIVTGDFNRGKYFAQDCRSVLERGVSHVMRLFLQHFTDQKETPSHKKESDDEKKHKKHTQEMDRLIAVNCVEEALDNS